MINNELLLLSGQDIPCVEIGANIRQPKVKDIAIIGEDVLFSACNFLMLDKEQLIQANEQLYSLTAFQIIMVMLKSSDQGGEKIRLAVELLLSMLFPDYILDIKVQGFIFSQMEDDVKQEKFVINNRNYDIFLKMLQDIFCLWGTLGKKYDPANRFAEEIAKKIAQGKQKIAKIKGKNGENGSSIYARYISLLAVGQKRNINDYMDYTIFQLNDEFKRFQLKESYDIHIKAQMAGATGLDEIQDWTKNLYEDI